MFYWFWPSSFPIKIAWKLKLFLESRNEGNHLLCRVMILIRKEETLWGKQHYKLSFETFVWRACQVTKKCACYRYLITVFFLLGWHQKLGIFCYKMLDYFLRQRSLRYICIFPTEMIAWPLHCDQQNCILRMESYQMYSSFWKQMTLQTTNYQLRIN